MIFTYSLPEVDGVMGMGMHSGEYSKTIVFLAISVKTN